MDDTQARGYVIEWRRNADLFERRNKSINRSKCFDGARQLNVGMAAAWRSAADQLESALTVEPPPLPDDESMVAPSDAE